jgi:hypothetical protein
MTDKPRLPTLRITDELAAALDRKCHELRRRPAEIRRFALEYYLLGRSVPGAPNGSTAAVITDGDGQEASDAD